MATAIAARHPRAPVPPTPARLLDAAERLFATRGYAATSVRDITRAAGCNVAGINYYFGSKDELYRQVFARRLTSLRADRVNAFRGLRPSPPHALDDVLGTFARGFLAPLASQGDGRLTVELMVRELVEPHLPAGMFRTTFADPIERAAATAFCAAVPGLSPSSARRCVRSLIAQLVHEIHVMRRQSPPPAPAAWRSGLADSVDHIVRFSAAGIRACAAPEQP